MKKRLRVMLAGCAAILVLTASVVVAQLRSGRYGSANVGTIGQTASTAHTPNSSYEVSSFPSFAPELAKGEGRQEVQSFCTTCHSPIYITMQPPLPAATWEAEVNKMIKTYGAPVPDATAKKIVSYLQEHYTTENRKE